jgi:hypothetical protein
VTELLTRIVFCVPLKIGAFVKIFSSHNIKILQNLPKFRSFHRKISQCVANPFLSPYLFSVDEDEAFGGQEACVVTTVVSF